MAIQFYYTPVSPPSCAVWMVLEALALEYNANFINTAIKEHKTEEYKRINPHAQLPAIIDGDIVLSESRAIAIYLCQKYEKSNKKEKLYPTDPDEIAKFHLYMMRDVDNYHRLKNYMSREAIAEGRAEGPREALLPGALGVLAEYDALLAKRQYIFGNHLTLLDFFHAHTVRVMAMAGFEKWDNYPNLKKWLRRLEKLPYYEKCYKQPTEASRKYWVGFLEKAAAERKKQKSFSQKEL